MEVDEPKPPADSTVLAAPPDGASGPRLVHRNMNAADVATLKQALGKLKEKGTDPSDSNYRLLAQLLSQATTAPPLTPAPKPAATPLTPDQVFQLRTQILAYKYLSKNLPIPQKLYDAIKNFSSKQQLLVQQQQQQLQARPGTQQQHGSRPPGVAAGVPGKAVAGAPQQQLLQQAQHPSQAPKIDPLPVTYLLQERERRIAARIQARIDELGDLPAELPSALKQQALIELKQLKLLQQQRRLRSDIAARMRRLAELEAAAEPATAAALLLKRSKKAPVRDQLLQLLNNSSKSPAAPGALAAADGGGRGVGSLDREQLKKQKHAEFLAAVIQHQKNFKDFFMNKHKVEKKMFKDILSYHSNEARRAQLEEERAQRRRLQALKENNEEEYLKILDQKKNEQISMLLKQTDAYLAKIGAMMQQQKDRDEIEEKRKDHDKNKEKAAGKKRSGKKEDDESVAEDEAIQGETASEKQQQYYSLAHTIKEEVKEQPRMLKGGQLKQYQLVGVQWLVSLYNNKLNGILADEMGLGKTIQTISLIAYLMEKKNDKGPYLVVVPLSTLSNWSMEFAKWAPDINLVVYRGKPSTRKQIFREEVMQLACNVVLSSYDFVLKDKGDLGKIEWNYIIIDEGHRIKNKNSKLSTTLRQHYMSRHRVLLTGTPLQNDLGELWSLLNFLLPSIFNSQDNFEQWFNRPFAYARKGGAVKQNESFIAPNEEESLLIINRLHKVLRPFLLRRLKKDVESELPDKVETVLTCDMSAMQKKMYNDMLNKGILLFDPAQLQEGKAKASRGYNNVMMQLQKICNHPYLFHEEYEHNQDLIRVSGKFDLLDRILPKLRAAGHRVLIFNQMTNLMDILEDYFQLRGMDFLRLDGTTKDSERQRLVQVWNAPDATHWLFILSTKAGGLGLNLQTADTVILFDTDWNPQMDLQAQDRVHRIGQKKEVRIFRLVSHNSIEEAILQRATDKLQIDAKVIQAGMFNTHSNDRMRRQMLEELIHADEDDEKDLEIITSDEQINTLLARNDEEFALYQQLDQEREEREAKEWKGRGRKSQRPVRLMQESELPDWLRREYNPTSEDITQLYGRGMRDRPEVQYDDGLSEAQFVRKLEDPDLEFKQRRRKAKDSEGADDASRKRPQPSPDARDPKRRKKEPAKEKKRSKAEQKMYNSFMQIWKAVVEEKDVDGRLRSTLFMKLPSKREYPHYYKQIARPISLSQIKASEYSNPENFKNDFLLLFSNAKEFNVPESIVYGDAIHLQRVFAEEFERHFGQAAQQEEGPSDEESTDMLVQETSNDASDSVAE